MSNDVAADLVAIEKIVSLAYVERVFDCYLEGRIAVPVDPGAAPPPGRVFAERITPAAGGGWFTRAQAPIHDERPAQVSFSSGTTGEPKAILLSHRALADATDRLIEIMEIDGTIREYLGVPPTYSFGLARARVVAAVGGSLYIPANGFDPIEFARMLDAGEVNALSAVPTLLRVLIANPELVDPKAARKLRWLEIGSQPMSAEDKHAIRRMFPGARIVQHYGLTEASRSTFLDLQNASDAALASVGKPIGATEVKIDGDRHICIRGPHVADGILVQEGLQSIVDAEGWLRTNDLGHIDEGGFLHFEGRADHLLNVGGIKIPAELFEQRLAQRMGEQAGDVAITGRADALRGEIVLVAHLPHVIAAEVSERARAVGALFGLGAADVAVIEIDSIPRTDTGKVQRKSLTERLDGIALPGGAAKPAVTEAGAGDGLLDEREREIAAIWREALGVATVSRDDTFFDMGGDSLSAITVMLRMERAGIAKEITQQIFEGRSIAEIAASTDGGPRQRRAPRAAVSDAITMTRGVLVCIVVASHWGPFLLLRTGSLAGPLVKWTLPFFRFGTPGFAMVFGIGLAYFNMTMIKNHADRRRANVRASMMILTGGVLTLALARATDSVISGQQLTPSNLFYGVLMAYLLLVTASGLILRFIAARRHPILTSIILALVSLLIAATGRQQWIDAQTTGIADLARLLLIAKYGFSEMFGYAAAGIAVGLWIDSAHDADDLPAQATLAGAAIILLSTLLTITLGLQDLWFSGTATMQMIMAYLGVILVLFGVMLKAIRLGYVDGLLKIPFRLLMMTGSLAFLIYVGHETAMSVGNSLQGLRIPYALAIGVPVLLFLLICAFAMRRLYRLYYGGRGKGAPVLTREGALN